MQVQVYLILCSGYFTIFSRTAEATLKSSWISTHNKVPYSEDFGYIFAKKIVNTVKASPTMTKLFDFHGYPKDEIVNAFYIATRDVATYINIYLTDIVANIARDAVEKAFDPTLFLEIFSMSLGQYLVYRNYLNPDPGIIAESFIRHLKESANDIDIHTSNALTIVQALVTSMNRFFIEDLIKSRPSLLSAFVDDLIFADYGMDFISDVVLFGNSNDKTNLTTFIKAAQRNISSDDTLQKIFNGHLTAAYVADRFYEVIYDARVISNPKDPENAAEVVKNSISLHYSPDNYKKAMLTAYGTFLFQHNYFRENYPKIAVLRFTKHLRNNFNKTKYDSEIELVLKSIHQLLTLTHITIESAPSFFTCFVGNLYNSKGIDYTFPNLLQYEIDHGLIDINWSLNYATSDP